MQVTLPEYTLLINGKLYIKFGSYPKSIMDKPLLYKAMKEEGSASNSKLVLLSTILDNEISNIKPSALIFHCSRCGSTLISQMIVAKDNVLVISESDAISSYLKLCLEGKTEFSKQVLNKILSLLTQGLDTNSDLIIKFSSWNVLLIKEVLSAFPSASWIYVVRNHEEVIESNLIKNTAPIKWFKSDKELASKSAALDVNELEKCDEKRFFKNCLTNYDRIVKDVLNINKKGLIIDYMNIKKEIFEICSNHFEFEISSNEYDRMVDRMSINSKYPDKGKFFPTLTSMEEVTSN